MKLRSHSFAFLSSPARTTPLFIAVGVPRICSSYAAPPAPRSVWPCAPELTAAAYLRGGLPWPRCLCSPRVPVREGGFSAPHPGFSIVPRPARDLPPAVKMVIQKEKKSCGQVVEEWKEFVWNPRTHQFMGRTGTSWGMRGRPC